MMRYAYTSHHWPSAGSNAATAMVTNAYSLTYLALETQAVMTMRILGMAGLWPVTRSENKRMLDEKLSAMTEAQWAMWRASLGLGGPSAVLAAGLRPLRVKTRSNARRLGKRAFKVKR
ncbi:antifreeze protein [Tateyamaria omphalii]|uniref:antifreeze protein n=1 Tax=Tateyamaria omphalii TaxID=299262 RepID=UPI001C992266|nr:antifreeze protein [Tateyamaria omphalii]MBY5931771.1 antifreeze protein [Tateyamaria omphalii]